MWLRSVGGRVTAIGLEVSERQAERCGGAGALRLRMALAAMPSSLVGASGQIACSCEALKTRAGGQPRNSGPRWSFRARNLAFMYKVRVLTQPAS